MDRREEILSRYDRDNSAFKDVRLMLRAVLPVLWASFAQDAPRTAAWVHHDVMGEIPLTDHHNLFLAAREEMQDVWRREFPDAWTGTLASAIRNQLVDSYVEDDPRNLPHRVQTLVYRILEAQMLKDVGMDSEEWARRWAVYLLRSVEEDNDDE